MAVSSVTGPGSPSIKISVSQFKQKIKDSLKEANQKVPPEADLDAFTKQIDRNGDQLISVEEFEAFKAAIDNSPTPAAISSGAKATEVSALKSTPEIAPGQPVRKPEKSKNIFQSIGQGLLGIVKGVNTLFTPLDIVTDGLVDIGCKLFGADPEGKGARIVKSGLRIASRTAVGAGIGFAIGGPAGAIAGGAIGFLLGIFNESEQGTFGGKPVKERGTDQRPEASTPPGVQTTKFTGEDVPLGSGKATSIDWKDIKISELDIPGEKKADKKTPVESETESKRTPAQECAGLITTNGATVQPKGNGKYQIIINDGKGEFELDGGAIFEGEEEDEETNVLDIDKKVALQAGKTYRLEGNVTRILPPASQATGEAVAAKASLKTEESEGAEKEIWQIIFENMPEELEGWEEPIKSQTTKIKEILENKNKTPDAKKTEIEEILKDNLEVFIDLSGEWAQAIVDSYEE